VVRRIRQVHVATRERVIGQVEEADAALIRAHSGENRDRLGRLQNEPAKLHVENFKWIPGFAFDPNELFSVKTKTSTATSSSPSRAAPSTARTS